MSFKILYNDGEGIDHNDFNLQRERHHKYLFDSIAQNFAAQNQVAWYDDATLTGAPNSLLRPLREALATRRVNSTTIRVNGGLVLDHDFSVIPVADGPVALVGLKEATEDFVVAATAATMWRRDVVEARVTVNNEAAESRDFEDAVTRELTTTNQVKRANVQVEVQIVTGAEVASQALADDPANEPAVTAGWHKVASVRVQDTGISNDDNTGVFDHRYPWGYWHASSGIASMFNMDVIGTGWTVASDANGIHRVSGSTNRDLIARIPFAEGGPNQSQGDSRDAFRLHRINRISLHADLVNAPIAGLLTIRRVRQMFGGLDLLELYPNPGGGGDFGLVAVSTAAAEHAIYDIGSATPDAQTANTPLWETGRTNPYQPLGNDAREYIDLRMTSNDVGDKIYGVNWEGFGGF